MKNKVNIDDFLVLIGWVKVYQFFELRRFDYQRIMDNVEHLYQNGVEYFDVSGNNIDNLMIDAYNIYIKINKSIKILDKLDVEIKLPYFDKDVMIEESQRFNNIIEYMFENVRYQDSKIRDIQKQFLINKMKECSDIEDYENAAIFRDLIKEC